MSEHHQPAPGVSTVAIVLPSTRAEWDESLASIRRVAARIPVDQPPAITAAQDQVVARLAGMLRDAGIDTAEDAQRNALLLGLFVGFNSARANVARVCDAGGRALGVWAGPFALHVLRAAGETVTVAP